MENDILNYYYTLFALKNVVRNGWVKREVDFERLESDGEHTFSCINLARIIMDKQQLPLDKARVYELLANHDIGESIIGDFTPKDSITPQEKIRIESDAVKTLSQDLNMPQIFVDWQEFEYGLSDEALFAKKIDKLDALFQAKVYDGLGASKNCFEEFSTTATAVADEFNDLFEQ